MKLIEKVLKHLENVFKTNGCNNKQFDRAILRFIRGTRAKNINENREVKSIILLYIKGKTDKISKNLNKRRKYYGLILPLT